MTTKLLVTIIITVVIAIVSTIRIIINCKRNKPNRMKDILPVGFFLGAMISFAFSFNIPCGIIMGSFLAAWAGSSIRIPSND